MLCCVVLCCDVCCDEAIFIHHNWIFQWECVFVSYFHCSVDDPNVPYAMQCLAISYNPDVNRYSTVWYVEDKSFDN